MCPDFLDDRVIDSSDKLEIIIGITLARNRDFIRVRYGWNPDDSMALIHEVVARTLEDYGVEYNDDVKSITEECLRSYGPRYEQDVGYWNSLSIKDIRKISRKAKDPGLQMVDYVIVRIYSLLDDYSRKMLAPIDYDLFMNNLLIELRDREDNHQFSYNGQFIVHNLDTIVKKVSEAVITDRQREIVFRGNWDKTVVPNYNPKWKILLESNRFHA